MYYLAHWKCWCANTILTVHILLGLIILFGWLWLDIRPAYLLTLVGWPLCWVVFGYCPLTKWEFQLRERPDAGTSLNGEIVHHYSRKLIGVEIPVRYILMGGYILLSVSIIGNVAYELWF